MQRDRSRTDDLGPPLRATTPRRLFRRLRHAHRLTRRGDAGRYLAAKVRIHALAEALGTVGEIERIWMAAQQ